MFTKGRLFEKIMIDLYHLHAFHQSREADTTVSRYPYVGEKHCHMSLFGGIAQGHVYITVWCTIASALAVSMLMSRRRKKNKTTNEVYKILTHTGTEILILEPEETCMKVMDLGILNTIKLLQSKLQAVHQPKTAISWSVMLIIRTLMFSVLSHLWCVYNSLTHT